jgi:hypothetical protein
MYDPGEACRIGRTRQLRSPVACRRIVSAASGHFFARSKCLNVVQCCPATMCFGTMYTRVVFLAHEEEEAVHVMPEMDLRLPRAEIVLCRRLSRDRLLAAGSANCCRVVHDAEG